MDNEDFYSHRNAGVRHAAPFQTSSTFHNGSQKENHNGSQKENDSANPVEFTPCVADCPPNETDVMVVSEVPAPDRLRQSGARGIPSSNIPKKLPRINISKDGNNIVNEGPREQVQIVDGFLGNYIPSFNTVVDDVVIQPEIHCHIIGRRRATAGRIEKETSTAIYFPSHAKYTGVHLPRDVIRINGHPASVAAAKEAIKKIAAKFGHNPAKEQTITATVNIDPTVHGRLIGSRGRNVIKLQSWFHVYVHFSDIASEKHLVKIWGRKENVEKAKDKLLSLAHHLMQLDAVKLQRFVQSLSASGCCKDHNRS